MADIVVVGSINTDMVVTVPQMPRAGETVLGGEFQQIAGGKGANQAVAAAIAVTRPGAQPSAPYRHEINAMLESRHVADPGT